MMKFRKGDTLKITSGKDKGREGKVERVFASANLVLVEGINLYKKHVKGGSGVKGGVYNLPRPLPVSKIALICPKCKQVTRVGFRIDGDEKVRVCKKCSKALEIGKK